jgi:hypothetical protein
MMLVDNPQDERYKGGVLCFMYRGNEDGPSEAVHFYDGWTIDQVIVELEETCERNRADWSTIPDQLLGCQDDWIAPVRIARDEQGHPIPGVWEKLVAGQWIRFS